MDNKTRYVIRHALLRAWLALDDADDPVGSMDEQNTRKRKSARKDIDRALELLNAAD